MSLLLLALGTPAGSAAAGGSRASWWFEPSDLVLLVEAPTEGWVAVGFNPEPELAGSRLVMVSVRGGTAVAEEHLAQPPDHPKQRDLVVRAFVEEGGSTRVLVAVPRAPAVAGTMRLEPGRACGLTLAYSESDDFAHHSRWRGLVPTSL